MLLGVVVVVVALVAVPVGANVERPVTWRDVQGLAQNATHVVRARFVGYERARSDTHDDQNAEGVAVSDIESGGPIARLQVDS